MSELRTDRGGRPVPNSPEPASAGPKRMITAGIALGAVAAFGIGIWFAYDQGVKRGVSGAPPLVRADQSPTKVAPENPGGMQVPNQDKQIYERLGGSGNAPAQQAEKLLPPPERANDAPRANTNVANATSNAVAPGTAPVTVPTRPAPAAVPNQTPPNQTTAPTPNAAPRPGTQTAAASATPTPAPRTPVQTAPATASAAPAPAASASAGGSAKVQLASLKEQSAAQSTWAALQKKFPSELGSLSASYERVELGDKGTYYRLQAGPLKDRATAQALCQKLEAGKQGCIVVGR